jgi:hypothetical protein
MVRGVFAWIWLLAACAAAPIDDQVMGIVAPVERDVDRAELFEAVRREVERAPVCLKLPTVWWETRAPFTVRYGPPQWRGTPIPSDAEAQMDAFVQLGFWSKTPRPDLGENVFQYTFTESGERYYRGHPYQGRGEAHFCPPAERGLVRITDTEWGDDDGPLLVRFAYAANSMPSWLPTLELQQRYASALPQVGAEGVGVVRLNRVWSRDRDPPERAPRSGRLEPFCYDYVHNHRDACGAVFR